MTDKRIEITFCELKHQIPTEQSEGYILLHEKFIRYSHNFYADEPKDMDDLELGWHNVHNCYECFILKETVAGFEMGFINDQHRWKDSISLVGHHEDLRMYFIKRKKAEEVFQALVEYLFG